MQHRKWLTVLKACHPLPFFEFDVYMYIYIYMYIQVYIRTSFCVYMCMYIIVRCRVHENYTI